MEAIEENSTWRVTTLPPSHRAIGLKWVYKVKKDAHGAVLKHKARLVAKGYVQQHGIDYDKVFSPVGQLESVWLLVALAASAGWDAHHMDIMSAFLNDELEEEVYMQQLIGFTAAGKERMAPTRQGALRPQVGTKGMENQARGMPRQARLHAMQVGAQHVHTRCDANSAHSRRLRR
jgi:hypothetical protein